MLQIDLNELAGGELGVQFQEAAKRVIANMLDPNTSYKNKRGITIKLTFEQNEARNDVTIGIQTETKLAPQQPIKTHFAIGKDLRTDELYMQEYGGGIRGQASIEDYQGQDGGYSVDGTREPQ